MHPRRQNILRKIGAQTHAHHQRIKRRVACSKLPMRSSTLTHRPPSSSQRVTCVRTISPSSASACISATAISAGRRRSSGLNHAHTVVHTQYAHDIFMRMRQHLGDNHAVAADALSKDRVTEKRAARASFAQVKIVPSSASMRIAPRAMPRTVSCTFCSFCVRWARISRCRALCLYARFAVQ